MERRSEAPARPDTPAWPKRALFSAAGAAAAGAPVLASTCNGACTSCYRCGVGAAVVLALVLIGGVGRKVTAVRGKE